jgi:hypothetical protein
MKFVFEFYGELHGLIWKGIDLITNLTDDDFMIKCDTKFLENEN